MANGYYTTAEVAQRFGLTTVRCTQHARRFGVQRLGKSYIWTDADVASLENRIGMRGRPIR